MYIRTIPLILTIATSTAYAQEFSIESAERKASSSIYQEFPVDNSAWDSESSQSAGFANLQAYSFTNFAHNALSVTSGTIASPQAFPVNTMFHVSASHPGGDCTDTEAISSQVLLFTPSVDAVIRIESYTSATNGSQGVDAFLNLKRIQDSEDLIEEWRGYSQYDELGTEITYMNLQAGVQYELFTKLDYLREWGVVDDVHAHWSLALDMYTWNDEPQNALRIDSEDMPIWLRFAEDGPDPDLGCYMHKDVWYIFEPTDDGETLLSTCGMADFDTKIAIYEGTELPVTADRLIACNDDTSFCPDWTSELIFDQECGKKYLVRVGSYNDGSADDFGGQGRLLVIPHVMGEACPQPKVADFNGDGEVNGLDMGILLANWGSTGTGDLNNDGVVDGGDLGLFFVEWQS